MRVIHGREERVEGEGSGAFLLSSKDGSFLCLPNQPFNDSNYQGWATLTEGVPYKTIENIYLEGREVDAVHNQHCCVERDSGAATESFHFSSTGLIYSVYNYSGTVNVDFDFRRMNDYDDQGRFYEFYTKEGGLLVVKYKKYTDGSLRTVDHEHFLAFKNVQRYWVTGQWMPRHYSYDASRHSRADFYIYGTLKILVDKEAVIAIGSGKTEEEASVNANKAWHEYKLNGHAHSEEHHDAALNAALNALYSLTCKGRVLAGYPWFYQPWARDELIAIKALLLEGDFFTAKVILLKHLESLKGSYLSTKEGDSLMSADAPGWLFLRLHEFLSSTNAFDYFSREELRFALGKLEEHSEAVARERFKDGLVMNKALETWMDTSADGDTREGARVEVQALQLRAYKLGAKLSELLGEDPSRYAEMEEGLRRNAKAKLYKDCLADGFLNGAPDFTQRPNVFLAFYAYPELLSEEEWKLAFDKALEKLWLDWGGLASIEKDHTLFKPEHTGETNESYHRGDSWFFANNIAALCMHSLDPSKYAEKVRLIRDASVKEMLFSGFLGHCAELSSAKELSSQGCRAQAWSASTLAELLYALKG